MNQQLYNIIVCLKDFNLKLNEMEIKRKEENKIKGKKKKTMDEKFIMCQNKNYQLKSNLFQKRHRFLICFPPTFEF